MVVIVVDLVFYDTVRESDRFLLMRFFFFLFFLLFYMNQYTYSMLLNKTLASAFDRSHSLKPKWMKEFGDSTYCISNVFQYTIFWIDMWKTFDSVSVIV